MFIPPVHTFLMFTPQGSWVYLLSSETIKKKKTKRTWLIFFLEY